MRNERQHINWLGIVQAVLLIGWTSALCWLGSGQGDDALLGRFLRSDYWWIVYSAIVVFAVFLASLLIKQPHQLGLDRWRSLIQVIILSLPLLYLPLAVSSELSLEAAEKRSFYAPRVAVKKSETSRASEDISASTIQESEEEAAYASPEIVKPSEPAKPIKKERNPRTSQKTSKTATAPVKTREANLWDLISKPEDFEGSSATITGTVYRDKRLSADSFYCYRLLMVCCAADATPAGVIVKCPEASNLKKGTWVKVHGKVGFTEVEGEKWASILAAKVGRISPPKNKFLIPQ